jgi:hypothetical protein
MVTTLALHPAARRRIARMMPPEPHHDLVLRPLGAGDARTIIATSDAQDFVAGLFETLNAADWRTKLAAMRGSRRGADGLLELGLPVHRKFQIALFEALCRQPGSPRLDPARISAQGMVIRRRRGSRWQGWMKSGRLVSGWLPLAGEDADPDPRKRGAAPAGNRQARALIARQAPSPAAAEEILGLYVAPPDICLARGRTILFGLVPVASNARSDGPADPIDYANGLSADARSEMVAHFSEYLKARPKLAMPRAGEDLSRDWNVLNPPLPGSTDAARLNAFGLFLHQLVTELDAFGTGPAPRALMGLLRQIRLPTQRNARGEVTGSIDAAGFVTRAVPILLDRQGNPPPPPGGQAATQQKVRMPLEWPVIDAALGARLTRAALECLSEHHARLARSPGKFDVLSDQYAVRGFIRVRGPAGCPDKLVWSAYSERFRILPWWDGDGPATRISLPDLSQLKKVKPSVAFDMPPAIANLLNGDMKELAEGKGSTDGPQIGWLCSFSIPFITLCAFIVLHIFLGLLNLVFQWMMFIKICIPIPKKAE